MSMITPGIIMLVVGGIGLLSTIIWTLVDFAMRRKKEQELIQKASKQVANFAHAPNYTPRKSTYSTSLKQTDKIEIAEPEIEMTEAMEYTEGIAEQTSSTLQTESMVGAAVSIDAESGQTESIIPVTAGMKNNNTVPSTNITQGLGMQKTDGMLNKTESIFTNGEPERKSKFCIKCGTPIYGDGRFCTKCGFDTNSKLNT